MHALRVHNIITILVMLVVGSNADAAGEVQGNLQVTATVSSVCEIIELNSIDFGTYNPFNNNNLDATGSLRIRCNEGTIPTIQMNYGENATSVVNRRLKSSSNEYIPYDIFQDQNGSHTTKWGNGSGGVNSFVPNAAPSFTGTTYQIYGRVYPHVDAPTGTYQDTVTVTVSF